VDTGVEPPRAGLPGREDVRTNNAEPTLRELDAVAQVVRQLETAQDTRTPCAPIRGLLKYGDADIDLAYAVQSELIARRTATGARVVGRKIGLTNPKVQIQLGVDRPDFGVLLDDMYAPAGEPVDMTRLLQPKIEAEIAFILNADLDQAGLISESDVAAATDHVVAALEIVDSRVAGWDISIIDTIADNGSSAMFALGDQPVGLDGLDLVATAMTMTRNGEHVCDGTGPDCLGNPLTAVAWLANTARDYGAPLRAGEIILSGALGPMVPVAPGSSFTADITGIGTVAATFTDTGENA